MSDHRVLRLSTYAATAAVVTTAGADIVVLPTAIDPSLHVLLDLGEAVGSVGGAYNVVLGTYFGAPDLFAYGYSYPNPGISFGYQPGDDLFDAGDMISGAQGWSTSGGWNINFSAVGEAKYIGFRIDSNMSYTYGWIEVKNTGEGMTIERWAYADTPGAAIVAGASGSSTPAVPGLGGLAALAMGAAGVRRNRQRVA